MRPFALILFNAFLLAASAQAAYADGGQKILIDRSKPLTYVSAVSHSTTWTGERVLNLGHGQCERDSQQLMAMRHINGVDLPDIAVKKVVAPCEILGVPRTR